MISYMKSLASTSISPQPSHPIRKEGCPWPIPSVCPGTRPDWRLCPSPRSFHLSLLTCNLFEAQLFSHTPVKTANPHQAAVLSLWTQPMFLKACPTHLLFMLLQLPAVYLPTSLKLFPLRTHRVLVTKARGRLAVLVFLDFSVVCGSDGHLLPRKRLLPLVL